MVKFCSAFNIGTRVIPLQERVVVVRQASMDVKPPDPLHLLCLGLHGRYGQE